MFRASRDDWEKEAERHDELDARKLGAEESGADDHDADPSASLMGHGSSWAAETEAEPSTTSSRCRGMLERLGAAVLSTRTILDAILLIAIVALILGRRPGFPHGTVELDLSGDITGFAPRISRHIQTFSPDPAFVPTKAADFFTPEVKQKWLSIVPKGLGYLKVEHPENYRDLPTPLETYHPTTFTTSVTHQLHCLHAIADNYASLVSNNTDKSSNHEGFWHLAHCFDYLRQSIMCCGDTALEGQQTTFPPGFVGSDGWDAKHVCKDYSQVKDYLEKNRQNDDVWI